MFGEYPSDRWTIEDRLQRNLTRQSIKTLSHPIHHRINGTCSAP